MDRSICALGIDLTGEYAQVSYMFSGYEEPVSLSISTEDKKYLIPAALYYRSENDTWYLGDEAVFNSESDKRKSLSFDEDIKNNEENLQKYLELILERTKKILEADIKGNICVSEEDCDLNSIRYIYNSLKRLGYDEEDLRVINHDEAFIYYTINQKKELWLNDVALFDFTKKHFKYRRIHEVKSRFTPGLTVDTKDMSDIISYAGLDTDYGREDADIRLRSFVQQEFKKYIVCTVFLTGAGFYDEWMKESIGVICSKRRVFKGYNLFVKGACYAANKKYLGIDARNHIFQCKGRTKADIRLTINNKGKNVDIVLSQAGSNWYEAGAEADCILDNVNKLNFVIAPALEGKPHALAVDVSDFPGRPNKTTRVKILLSFRDDSAFDIVVKDMGFGDIFKSSGKFVKTTVSLKDGIISEELE